MKPLSLVSQQRLEKKIGYAFSKNILLQDALSHKSVCPHSSVSSFERLEFLGDRVLNLIISEKLYCLFPEESENHLSVRLSQLINRDSLYCIAQNLNLSSYLRFDTTNPSQKKILSDALEALIGALFLDSDFLTARKHVLIWWEPLWKKAPKAPQQNSKSALQDWTQRHYGVLPIYQIISQTGLAHKPSIEVKLSIPIKDKKDLSIICVGTSKREAEKKAALAMLTKLQTQITKTRPV